MIGAQTKLNIYFTIDSEFVNSFNKELMHYKLLKWDSYAYTSISLPTYTTRIFSMLSIMKTNQTQRIDHVIIKFDF